MAVAKLMPILLMYKGNASAEYYREGDVNQGSTLRNGCYSHSKWDRALPSCRREGTQIIEKYEV